MVEEIVSGILHLLCIVVIVLIVTGLIRIFLPVIVPCYSCCHIAKSVSTQTLKSKKTDGGAIGLLRNINN